MGRPFSLAFALVCLFFTSSALGKAVITPFATKMLGTIGTKAFFYDITPGDWMEAKDICAGLGMRMARINSLAEQNFLKGKANPAGFIGSFWISGRETLTFSWDETTTLLGNFGQKWTNNAVPKACVHYVADAAADVNGGWATDDCTATAKVLCETF